MLLGPNPTPIGNLSRPAGRLSRPSDFSSFPSISIFKVAFHRKILILGAINETQVEILKNFAGRPAGQAKN
jgi:hypothetical protein